MKQCPKCNRTYRDDTLRFCLDDGVPLIALAETRRHEREPPPTAVMPEPSPTMKSVTPSPTVPSYSSGEFRQEPRGRQSHVVLTVGVVAIAVLLLALVGLAAYFVLRPQNASVSENSNALSNQNQPSNSRRNDSTPSESPRSGDEIVTPSPSNGGPLKITASASSERLALQSNTYYASNAIDGKRTTAWIEGVDGPGIGEWIRFDFDREILVHRILIQPGYFKSPQIWEQNNRLAVVTAQFSDGSSRDLTFSDSMTSQKADVGAIRTRWVRLVIKSVYYGTNPGSTNDTALSEVAFEWEP